MNIFQKVSAYLLIVLNAMLLILGIFEEQVSVPETLQIFGRLHPVVLHLPIGVFLVATLLFFLRNSFPNKNAFSFLFLIAAILAVVTAICGVFLGSDPSYNSDELFNHKVTGIGSSFLCWFVYELHIKKWKYNGYLMLLGTLLILFTGHYGGMLTHGEDFLFPSFNSNDNNAFDKKKTVYQGAIFPIFENKCLACHNDQKLKGQLNMSSLEKLLKGGKNGKIWEPNNAFNSHLIQQVISNPEAKGHMPPKGKPQLTYGEISLLENWINNGADTLTIIADIPDSDTLRFWIDNLYRSSNTAGKVYEFKAADEDLILALNTPFCSINPLSIGSPALKADFYVQEKFELSSLLNLEQINTQLVDLNLNKMPVNDDQVSFLSSFPNLERINLNYSNISGENLHLFSSAKSVKSISLSGCPLVQETLDALSQIESLETVFLWDTGLDSTSIAQFQLENPHIKVDMGSGIEDDIIIKLNPPLLLNEEQIIKDGETIKLNHVLPNVNIRYTSNGETPDSLSGKIYEDEIIVKDFLLLNTIATKEGWYASDIKAFSFFQSNFKADSAWLLSPTGPKYKGEGAKTLIDLKQGDKEIFTDNSWLGYQDNNAVIMLETSSQSLKGISLSYLIKQSSFIMPPTEIEVWAGDSVNELKLISRRKPRQLIKSESPTITGASFPLDKSYKYIKIIAKPISKLPKWHIGAGSKGWFFIDEIYLY